MLSEVSPTAGYPGEAAAVHSLREAEIQSKVVLEDACRDPFRQRVRTVSWTVVETLGSCGKSSCLLAVALPHVCVPHCAGFGEIVRTQHCL